VGEGAGVRLLLTPPPARLLLGPPLGELANRAVPVDHLDRWLARLRDDLAAVPDWPGRFAWTLLSPADSPWPGCWTGGCCGRGGCSPTREPAARSSPRGTRGRRCG
jgi:hypothetical protein